jgi:glycine/D-amino acid oxidase-like deaminating enzyme
LEVWPTRDGDIAVRRLTSASTSSEARRLRAGAAQEQLQTSSVAIIGLGAVGSFLADALARAGVTRFTLIDADMVLPGNLVRHTASETDIGRFKVDAVKRRLTTIFGLPENQIDARGEFADDISTIRELLDDHDLVVNASAEWTVSKMLRDNADALEVHALTVVLQNEGRTFRVDVLPPFDNADPLASSDRGEPVAAVYEAGCGSPVSLTPPPAVAEAAAAAARHVVAMLTGKPLSAAGEIRELDLFEGGVSR